jgi:hypothetical protein
VVYIGISYSVDFIWDFPIVIGKPIHFGDSWLDPPVLLPSPYHNPLLDMFQNCNTLLTSLNVPISRGLEQFQSLNLAKSAQVTMIRKDDWSRAGVHSTTSTRCWNADDDARRTGHRLGGGGHNFVRLGARPAR